MEQFSLDEYLKHPCRKIVTRNGRNVRILCTDRNHPTRPIIALVQIDKCEEMYGCYTKYGSWVDCASSPNDLFFAPEKKIGWTNVYKYTFGGTHLGEIIYNSKEEAENNAKVYETDINTYITTIKIEWEE